jgi:hypothetical protein
MSIPSPPAAFMKIVAPASVKNQTRFLPLPGSAGISVIARLILRRVNACSTPLARAGHAPGANACLLSEKTARRSIPRSGRREAAECSGCFQAPQATGVSKGLRGNGRRLDSVHPFPGPRYELAALDAFSAIPSNSAAGPSSSGRQI